MAGFVEDTLHQQVRYIRPTLADGHEHHVIRRAAVIRELDASGGWRRRVF